MRPLLAFLALLTLQVSSLSQETLRIHEINVQQGGCTLIVGPDGTIEYFCEPTALGSPSGKRSRKGLRPGL